MRSLLLLSLFLSLVLSSLAQSGYETRTIATTDPLLDGDSLNIYFSIPESYDAAVPSKLIIGFHGLGNPNNSVQIREYLTPLGNNLNAVVMCPDPYLQDQPRSEAVLHLAYDSVMTWYNIDPTQVYITGYSAGSDVAARYVFGDPQYPMKGLIWHSPGFFFSPDLSDPQTIPPVCLCSGTQDFTSILQTNLLNSNLNSSGIPYTFIAMQGVGHTMDYPTFTEVMQQCITFIDAQYSTDVEEMSRQPSMMFPNPLTPGQTLFVSGVQGDGDVRISDLAGKLQFSIPFANADGQIHISATLSAGTYLVQVSNLTNKTMHRLMVQ